MDSYNALFSRFVAEAMISGLRQGLNLDDLLQQTGISLSQLHQPDFQLPIETGIYMVYRIYTMSPIPGVALRIGAQMRPSDFGPLGLAMISAPSVAAGLGKLHKLPSADQLPWDFTLIEADNRSNLIINTNDDLLRRVLQSADIDNVEATLPDMRRYFLEVGLMMARASWVYAGKQVMPTPLYVHLDFPQQSYLNVYQRYFDCPLFFEQSETSIVFQSADLRVKPVGSDPELQHYSEQQLGAASRQSDQADTSWSARTQTVLRHGGIPFLSAETVAQRLNISCRMLRRHLADEGTSFRELLQRMDCS